MHFVAVLPYIVNALMKLAQEIIIECRVHLSDASHKLADGICRCNGSGNSSSSTISGRFTPGELQAAANLFSVVLSRSVVILTDAVTAAAVTVGYSCLAEVL